VSDSTPPKSGDRRLSLRELITLARERLGPDAAQLKTREELETALFAPARAPAPAPPPVELVPAPVPVVVRDFFITQPGRG
jgi:hypothetical protein